MTKENRSFVAWALMIIVGIIAANGLNGHFRESERVTNAARLHASKTCKGVQNEVARSACYLTAYNTRVGIGQQISVDQITWVE